MECCIGSHELKIFARAVHCLSKIGEDVNFEVKSDTVSRSGLEIATNYHVDWPVTSLSSGPSTNLAQRLLSSALRTASSSSTT
eukprot:m.41488 g.41488  ORF g.41488 m.41488 type:complete len:83 (+) comp12837_c0_seq1:66-314(+)